MLEKRNTEKRQDTQPVKPLASTLAQRVQEARLHRGFSLTILSEKTGLDVEQIEDIESGLVSFLSTTVRQRLARGLRLKPSQLFEVEVRPASERDKEAREEEEGLSLTETERFWFSYIPQKPETSICPRCGEPVIVTRFERWDLDHHLLWVDKAHCSRCLFRTEKEH
ncbi:MAG: helix-turn-helix domain-containing protein [Cyanobacteria bacterium]|nr:helix-turn-helix domain-containing protein [Cyanobacteriota bacterium]